MKRFRVTSAARADIREAAARIESYRPGAGAEFRAAVEAAFQFIRKHPRAGAVCGGGDYRKRPIAYEPKYMVIWLPRGDEVNVVAVQHGRRDPDAWMDRLGE